MCLRNAMPVTSLRAMPQLKFSIFKKFWAPFFQQVTIIKMILLIITITCNCNYNSNDTNNPNTRTDTCSHTPTHAADTHTKKMCFLMDPVSWVCCLSVFSFRFRVSCVSTSVKIKLCTNSGVGVFSFQWVNTPKNKNQK